MTDEEMAQALRAKGWGVQPPLTTERIAEMKQELEAECADMVKRNPAQAIVALRTRSAELRKEAASLIRRAEEIDRGL